MATRKTTLAQRLQLPSVPSDLAGWEWERSANGPVRLRRPADGATTQAHPSSRYDLVIDEARQLGPLSAHHDPRLPSVPSDLAGWVWESNAEGLVRLACPVEGWATEWYPFLIARDALSIARDIAARDAAQVAEEAPIRKAPPLRLSTTATAVAPFTPGPDALGVYRRPPDMPERLMVPPRDLMDGRWQPREHYDEAALVELTESIREHGVLEDLIAIYNENTDLELITGHRRKRAALAAGGRDVPVRVVEVTAEQADEIAIISNDARADLTDLERGKAYEKIIAERGISEAELAKKLSRPRSYIQQRRALARACPELQQAYAQGGLSFTAARGICDGSGGDHQVQRATVAVALKALKAGSAPTGEGLLRQAQLIIFERAEKELAALGWRTRRIWIGSTPHIYWFAPTAQPAEWSPAEILAACKEQRRPPAEQPQIAQITKEDAEQTARRGWKVDLNFAPWPAVETEAGLILGEAAIAAAAQARADVAALIARFQAKDWIIAWEYTSYWIATTGKGKAKREELCVNYGEALKLIEKIEKGKLSPAKAESGNTYAPVCDVCRHKSPNHKNLDGKTVCASCAPPIEAALANERARIAQALEAQGVLAWLQAAPAFVADLVLAEHFSDWRTDLLGPGGGWCDADVVDRHVQALSPEQRQLALRAVVADLAWGQRPTTTARHLAPATAVAAPTPAATSPEVAAVRSRLVLARAGADDATRAAELAHARAACDRVAAGDPERLAIESELDQVAVWFAWGARRDGVFLEAIEIAAFVGHMEARWAAGVARVEDDSDTLTRLGDAVEALPEGAEREDLMIRLGNLWARLDEGL